MITFSILKQCLTFFSGRNLSNVWAKHLILVGYSVGINLSQSTKIPQWKIVEGIASVALIFWKHPYINLNELRIFFLLKSSFNCKSSNLVYVFICQGCKEEYWGETGCQVKEQINIYRQHIRYSKISTIGIWRTFTYLWRRKVSYISFFQDSSRK